MERGGGQEALLNGGEKLSLQAVLADQQLVVAHAVLLVGVASILYVPALSAPGADDHAPAALAADQDTAEQVVPGPLRAGHAAQLAKPVARAFAAILYPLPQLLGDNPPCGNFNPAPNRFQRGAIDLPARFRVTVLLRSAPDVHRSEEHTSELQS